MTKIWRARLTLSGIALIGLTAMCYGAAKHIIFLEHLGSALMVGAVLGLTVEVALREELVADAVKAALGWVLPPPLRPELNWIYEQALIWRDTDIQVHLEERGDHVVAKCKVHRTLENASSRVVKDVHIRFSVDDWGVAGLPTKITGYKFKTAKETYDLSDTTMVKTETAPMFVASYPDFKIDLSPGERVEQWIEYEETRGKNDMLYITHRYPVAGSAVTVTASPRIQPEAPGFHFAGKYEPRVDKGGGRYEVQRTLLPHQAVILRWTPKGSSLG